MAAGGAAQIFEMDAHHRFRFQVGSPINVSGESEGLEMASLVSTRDALPTHNTNASFAPNKHATVATEGDDFFKVRALAHTSHTSDLSPLSAVASFPLLITYQQATITLLLQATIASLLQGTTHPLCVAGGVRPRFRPWRRRWQQHPLALQRSVDRITPFHRLALERSVSGGAFPDHQCRCHQT